MEKTICKFCNLKSAAAQKLNEEEISVLENNCAEARFNAGGNIIKQDALSTNIIAEHQLDDARPGAGVSHRTVLRTAA